MILILMTPLHPHRIGTHPHCTQTQAYSQAQSKLVVTCTHVPPPPVAKMACMYHTIYTANKNTPHSPKPLVLNPHRYRRWYKHEL